MAKTKRERYRLVPPLPDDPEHKGRGVLVTDVRTGEDGVVYVEVAFGTSKKLNKLFSGEFSILKKEGQAFRESGLNKDTKFNLFRRVTLPWDKEHF